MSSEDFFLDDISYVLEEGAPWCVCRFDRSPREVCPCSYHIEELKRYGRCKCGLYWTKRACEEFKKKVKREASYCITG